VTSTFTDAQHAFATGAVLAYPTEAVFGIGCDPTNEAAVARLFALKQRDPNKGVILIAANYSQLLPFVDDALIPQDKRFSVLSHWPGPITLLLPARHDCPQWLTGAHTTIATRVTAFAPAVQLCKALNSALVSTSANISGEPALRSADAVREQFGERVGWVMDAAVGGANSPSKIINPITGQVVRESA